MSALMSDKMVDTLTGCVSDRGRKIKTMTTTANAIRTTMKLILSHLPLLGIESPLYRRESSVSTLRNIYTLSGLIIAHSLVNLAKDILYKRRHPGQLLCLDIPAYVGRPVNLRPFAIPDQAADLCS